MGPRVAATARAIANVRGVRGFNALQQSLFLFGAASEHILQCRISTQRVRIELCSS